MPLEQIHRAGKGKTEILEKSIPLFAEAGFNGISMRAIARAVGLNAATLYHYFPDKHALYIAALAHAFHSIGEDLSAALAADIPPELRLERFIHAFCRLVYEDRDFGRLLQREILTADETRLRHLAEEVFQVFFTALLTLCQELAPGFDPHLLAVSILGMIVHHYQSAPLRAHQPGRKPEHNDPRVVAAHVTRLLLHGILADS
jgi:AcrR family transcriptional regulator